MQKINYTAMKFAVLGLGDTGLSIINYLSFKHAKLTKVFDTRVVVSNYDCLEKQIKELYQEVIIYLGELELQLFDDVDVIITSPGVSIYEPVLQALIKHGKMIVGDIEVFAEAITNWPSKIIGITGTNGKTTVTTLTGEVCKSAGLKVLVAGNIGLPVLTALLTLIKKNSIPDVVVLELSSFQLETLYSLNLTAATVLNVSEDHLDRYRDLLEYAATKANIFNNNQVQILNVNDPLVMAMKRPGQKALYFGDDGKYCQFTLKDNCSEIVLQVNGDDYLKAAELNLLGMHNYYNILVSLALAQSIGVNLAEARIKDCVINFKGLPHRMEKVALHNGVLYVEDSKGTNVHAVVAGVSGLSGKVHLILGGDGKGQDFTPLRALVTKKCQSVALIGQDQELIASVLDGVNGVAVAKFATLPEAVKFCHNNAKAGEAVVLSPACASWDMFTNYKERAQVFVKSVNECLGIKG